MALAEALPLGSQPGRAPDPEAEYLSDEIPASFSSPPPFASLCLWSWGNAVRPGGLTLIGKRPGIILLLLKS